MVTPDPRRGDEPGDPNITPGAPRPDDDERPDRGTPPPPKDQSP